MFFRERRTLLPSFFLTALLLMPGLKSSAQQNASRSAAAPVGLSITDIAHNLPSYLPTVTIGGPQPAYLAAIENASPRDRAAALPDLIRWVDDQRPKVRSFALLTLDLLSVPSETRPASGYGNPLPAEYVPIVAAHLRDPDPSVRKVTFAALQSTEYSGVGLDTLVAMVAPMLREPDVLTEYPDPSFIESHQYMLAHLPPDQQAAYKAMPRKVIRLPADGAGLLGILAVPRRPPSNTLDDAMIAFLDREDQTKSTLAACLHILALSAASERVNDEALRRVFEQKAMTAFLLQFVASMRLTPEQLAAQKERLLALAQDQSTTPALRGAATHVATCWNGDRHHLCQPNPNDLRQQSDAR